MSERYTKIFSLPENLYADNSPIVIKAGALLKDNEAGSLIAQLKLQNITKNVIKSVKIELITQNSSNSSIGHHIGYEYSNLNADYGTSFGTQSPIELTCSDASSYTVRVTEVKFKDGTLWKGTGEMWQTMTQVSPINSVAISNKYEKSPCEKDKTKTKKILLTVLIPCSIFLLAFLSYFVAYPMIARMTGNHKAYFDIYNVKEYKIPSTVTKIENNAFKGYNNLESVVIPGNVEYIGSSAFMLCKNLKSVTIEEGVKRIDQNAFWGCESLESITIPNSITIIGDSAFFNCNNLTTITIGNGVTNIGNSAFQGCSKLKNVLLGNNVTNISSRAFGQCTKLESIKFPDSVISIGPYAFQDCYGLVDIKIGKNISEISEGAFWNCNAPADVYYAGSEEDWDAINISFYYEFLPNATIHYNYLP